MAARDQTTSPSAIGLKGYLHNNPDDDANPKLGEIAAIISSEPNSNLTKFSNAPKERPWGAICTPDEIRYIWMIGNSSLTTQDGTFYSDESLAAIVDRYAFMVAQQLKWDIYPVLRRHRSAKSNEIRDIEDCAQWESSYSYRPEGYRNFWQTRLRHGPILRVLKWELHNPFDDTASPILDLHPGMEINELNRTIWNTRGTARTGNVAGGRIPLRSHVFWGYDQERRRLPSSYFIDYITGYDHASRVPDDLREVVSRYVFKHVASGYGDGLTAGLANFSISLGVIHESAGTTQSATSALFGARLKENDEWLKNWWDKESHKYAQPEISL